MNQYHQSLERLLRILEELREKCPWDKKQTIHSLRSQTIEELYELTEAITEENWQNIKEELGDVLLHILFYSKIAEEQKKFDIGDVILNVSNKLVARHPHIYSNISVENEEEVKQNWEKIKLQEGKKSALEGVPRALPAMVKAIRLQEKAKQVGFEWDNNQQVLEKIKEEIIELEKEITAKQQVNIEKELGDVFFSLINYARFIHVDPENALEQTNLKFKKRFEAMEQLAKEKKLDFSSLSLVEMDDLWNEVKKHPDFE